MGFFGGNTNSLPQPDQNSAGVPPAQISTNEQARPVPLFYGTRRMGVTFLSQAFDQHADEVKDHSGGKFGSDRVTGYNYYSSFAALVAHGPVDFIREIWFDNQKVWSSDPPLARDDDNPISAPIQINGYGSWTFYWGTEGQTIDDPPDHKHGLASLATGVVVSPNVAEDHPGYVGLCYFVARDQFLGFQRTNIQNIEVVVGRFPKTFFGVPAPRPSVVTAEYNSWLPDGTERIDHSYTDGSPAGADANPVAILVDMLVNTRYGLSLRDVSDTDTALDRAALSALATRFKTTESFGLSPFIDRQQAFSETLTQLLEHVDGWLVADAAGRLTMGLARQQETDELPEISPDALTALPEIANAGWNATSNFLWLKYTNALNAFQSDAVPGGDLANLQITGEPNTLTLDRGWITRPDIADRLAIIAGKMLGIPQLTGRLKLRKSSAGALRPGALFKLDYEPLGLSGLACRATARNVPDPSQPEVEIEFEADRHYLAEETYQPPDYQPPGSNLNAPGQITKLRVFQWPGAYGDDFMLACVAAQPSPVTTGFILYNLNSNTNVAPIKGFSNFALHGSLTAAFAATDEVKIQITFDVAPPDIDPTQADADSGDSVRQWILIVCAPDIDMGAYHRIGDEEFMAIYGREAVEGDTTGRLWKYSVRRELWDSARLDHASGAKFFLCKGEALRANLYGPKQLFSGDPVDNAYNARGVLAGAEADFDPAGKCVTRLENPLRYQRPWKPRNLAVDHPTWDGTGGGLDFTLTWALNSAQFGDRPFDSSFDRGYWWWLELIPAGDSPVAVTRLLGTGRVTNGYEANTLTATVPRSFAAANAPGKSFTLRLHANAAYKTVGLAYLDDTVHRSHASAEVVVTKV